MRSSWTRTGIAVGAAACVAGLAVSGCGSEAEEPAPRPAAVETTTGPPETEPTETQPTETVEAAPQFVNTWLWEEQTTDGYVYGTTFSSGTFGRIADSAPLPWTSTVEEIIAACSTLNPEADAIAPFEVSVQNRTEGFSASVGTKIYEATGTSTQLEAAMVLGDGPTCVEMTDASDAFFVGGAGIEIDWPDTVSGDTAGPAHGYLIIRDFFTPAYPEGDPAKLSNAMLDANAQIRWKDKRALTSLIGPGVIKTPTGLILAYLPLSGKTECTYAEGDLACGGTG